MVRSDSMLIGSLNNPANDLIKEIRWVSRHFDFLDLTLELPKAHPDHINIKSVKALLNKKNLHVVGHTAWYLPIGSPFKELRMYALQELEKSAAVFEALGVGKMNVHFDNSLKLLKEKHIIDLNIWTLRRLVSVGRHHNIRIMAENTPGMFSQPKILAHIFRKVPQLLLHLDIAHANIAPKNQAPAILRRLSKLLTHMHISGNHGKHDEHLSITKGNINWTAMLSVVKKTGYDGTISLEVFTSPKARIEDKPRLRKLWDSLPKGDA